MPYLDIAEVVTQTGLKPSALRYYEARGLIAADHRDGLRRQYGDEVIPRLGLIALCQEAGFELSEIAVLLDGALDWRQLVEDRLTRVRAQIEDLQQAEVALTHALGCTADDMSSCSHLVAAVQSTLERRRSKS